MAKYNNPGFSYPIHQGTWIIAVEATPPVLWGMTLTLTKAGDGPIFFLGDGAWTTDISE